jgi:hypothetical protein
MAKKVSKLKRAVKRKDFSQRALGIVERATGAKPLKRKRR